MILLSLNYSLPISLLRLRKFAKIENHGHYLWSFNPTWFRILSRNVSSIIFQVRENLEGIDLASSQRPPTVSDTEFIPLRYFVAQPTENLDFVQKSSAPLFTFQPSFYNTEVYCPRAPPPFSTGTKCR